MTHDDDFEIGPYLSAARSIDDGDPASKFDVLTRLETTLDLPGVPGSDGGDGGQSGPAGGAGAAPAGGSGGSPAAAGASSTGVLVKAASLVLVGIMAGAAAHAALSSSPSTPSSDSRSQAVALVHSNPGVTPPVEHASAALPVEDLPNAATPGERHPVQRPSSATAASGGRTDDLDAERTLLETARTALLRSDHLNALVALGQHGTRFPTGQMSEERESLAVQALVAAGRKDEARAKAAQFRRAFPRSLQAPALEALVAEPNADR